MHALATAIVGAGLAVTACTLLPLPPGARMPGRVWIAASIVGGAIGFVIWVAFEAIYDAVTYRVRLREIRRRDAVRRLGIGRDVHPEAR